MLGGGATTQAPTRPSAFLRIFVTVPKEPLPMGSSTSKSSTEDEDLKAAPSEAPDAVDSAIVQRRTNSPGDKLGQPSFLRPPWFHS
jgi:hypothetical protein